MRLFDHGTNREFSNNRKGNCARNIIIIIINIIIIIIIIIIIKCA